jgi:solute carrier family 25 phosphate transporter 23/24/25/41
MQNETVEGGLHGNKLIIQTAKKMWVNNGLRAYYRGLPMGLVGMFPYSAIDLATFEYLKRAITSYNAKHRGCHEDDANPGNFTTAAIGAFSGALGSTVVYPLNLLRTRLQSQGTAIHPPTYTGIWDVTQRTIKNEGTRGLFKGLTPNLLKVVPAVSIVSSSGCTSASKHVAYLNRPMLCMRTRRPCWVCNKIEFNEMSHNDTDYTVHVEWVHD